ncbi:hypothetical protein QE152_g37604 [Popillia japonica]|uniref:Peptidase A2 domain-containing protein n=1 Tax=Popillia japonica TaxID=7064 RepID=A0AAW1I9E4_POPJA
MVVLRNLAKSCEFKETLDDNLRDQFVSGLHNEVIKQRLFSEKKLNCVSAYNLARDMEAAKKNVTDIDGSHHVLNMRHHVRPFSGSGVTRSTGKESAKWRSSTCGRIANHPEKDKMEKETKDCCRVCGNDLSSQCFYRNSVCDCCVSNNKDLPIKVNIQIENVKLNVEIDTGSPVSLISDVIYKKYFSKLSINISKIKLSTYTGTQIESNGFIHVRVQFNEVVAHLKLYVVPNGGPALLGRQWLTALKINIINNVAVNNVKTQKDILISPIAESLSISNLIKQYQPIFDNEPGTYKNFKAKLYLKPGTVPIFYKPRSLAYGVRTKVELELQNLIAKSPWLPFWFSFDTKNKKFIKRKRSYLKLSKKFKSYYFNSKLKEYLGKERIPGYMMKDGHCIETPTEIAEAFASYFASVYAVSSVDYSLDLSAGLSNTLTVRSFDVEDVQAGIRSLQGGMSMGTDGIPAFVIKDCVNHVFALALVERVISITYKSEELNVTIIH